jgi:hypothetical protein
MAASKAAADNLRVFNNRVSGVPSTNPVAIADNVYSPEFAPGLVVEGFDLLENPSDLITRFGNLSDGSRTEPDENTYIILDHNPGGPTPDYDYGRHFLFQGHEMPNGNTNRAYLTRIDLDVAHPDHRITLMTPGDANGLTGFNSIVVRPGIRLVAPCFLPRKTVLSVVSSRWAPILIQTPAAAPVCERSMAASAVGLRRHPS